MTPQTAMEMLDKFALLDVRTKPEINMGMISEAEWIDLSDHGFLEKLQKLDKNKEYLVYCRSGNRSGYACRIMRQLGLKAHNLDGGIISWQNNGGALV